MTIKDDSELQHALAHIWLAVDYLARGKNKAALYELDSIEGLIFFNDEAERLRHLEGIDYGKASGEPMQEPKTETEEPAGKT